MHKIPAVKKPWDVAISDPVYLQKIRDRRATPDGKEWLVTHKVRAGVPVYQYPWSKMQIGDFFIVPQLRHGRAQLGSFAQAAQRYDFELSVRSWEIHDGEHVTDGFRVTLVFIGIRGLKRRANNIAALKIPLASNGHAARTKKWRDANNIVKPPKPAPRKGRVSATQDPPPRGQAPGPAHDALLVAAPMLDGAAARMKQFRALRARIADGDSSAADELAALAASSEN